MYVFASNIHVQVYDLAKTLDVGWYRWPWKCSVHKAYAFMHMIKVFHSSKHKIIIWQKSGNKQPAVAVDKREENLVVLLEVPKSPTLPSGCVLCAPYSLPRDLSVQWDKSTWGCSNTDRAIWLQFRAGRRLRMHQCCEQNLGGHLWEDQTQYALK